ncbi:MAG: MarR family transcriptional regulator [Burkholderiales bacterium]|jgi:DNA-binding MarR family transcriptional regulator|nr:MarR family transcriptional regulator [Burkholderiales bacterium]
MQSDLRAAAISDIALTVFRLNGTLLHWGDRLVEPLGLTSARWQMLGAIALANSPLTAPQVGEAMGVTRQGAQKQLNLLRDEGMLESRSNPAHKRSPLYSLTPKGRALYARADALWSAQAAQLAASIPATRLEATTQTLVSILRHLQTAPFALEAQS